MFPLVGFRADHHRDGRGGCWVPRATAGWSGASRWTSVRRAVPTGFQGRVGSVCLTGVVGGIVIGSARRHRKTFCVSARLTAQLRCYVPEPVDETWGRLRHLGTRREQLITRAGSQLQQMRDLLECVWLLRCLQRSSRSGRARGWLQCG
jgi:hypothetical protein